MARAAATPGGTDTYHHGNLAQALVTAGLEMAAEGGPEALSLRGTARRAGVSPTAVYRHFEDHAALVTAVKHAVLARLSAAMEQALDAPEPGDLDAAGRATERLTRIGKAYVAFALAHPGEYRVIFAGASFPEDPAAGVAAHDGTVVRDPYHILSEVLDEMVEAGAMPGANRPGAETPTWGMAHGVASLMLEGACGELQPPVRDQLVAMSMRVAATGLSSAAPPGDVPRA